MEHWEEVLPGRILRVGYEDLVNNLEGTTRKMLDHIGIEFEEQCLEFHKYNQATTTLSAAQVRDKIYTGSVAKWKKFEKHLEPMRAILEKEGYLDWH